MGRKESRWLRLEKWWPFWVSILNFWECTFCHQTLHIAPTGPHPPSFQSSFRFFFSFLPPSWWNWDASDEGRRPSWQQNVWILRSCPSRMFKNNGKNGGDLGKKGSDFWLQSWWLMNINQLVDPKGVRFESQAITWGGGNYPPTITYPTDFGKSGRSSTQRWKSVSEGIVLMEESWLTTWDRDNPVNNPPVVGSLSHYLWGFSNIPGGCLGKSSIICRVSCMLGGCLGFLNHQQYHPQPFQTPLSSNSW